VGDGHPGNDAGAVADIDDVAGRRLTGADHDPDRSRTHGPLKAQGAVGEGDRARSERIAGGHLSRTVPPPPGTPPMVRLLLVLVVALSTKVPLPILVRPKAPLKGNGLSQRVAAGHFNEAGHREVNW